MKSLAVLITALTLLGPAVFAQEANTNAPIKISAAEAKKHLNTEAIVTGKIVEVNKSERVVHINFEKPFPNHPFSATIFANKTNLFPEVDKLQGKTVEITGKIVEYRNRPEIVLTSTNQLHVVEKPAGTGESDKK
jgi:micrococcal nuclease